MILTQIKKIPRPLAMAVSIIFLFSGLLLINKSKSLFSSASVETSPHKIKVTNISDSSFIVSWITEEKTTGRIAWGENNNSLENFKNDARDKNTAQAGKYLNHFVPIEGLGSQTKLFFKIISGGKSYGNGDKPFEVTTAARLPPSENDLAQGKILTSGGQAAGGAIVYLSLPNTILQAALTDNNGHWMIPLSSARTIDLNNFSEYDRNAQIEEIFVQAEGETAFAALAAKNDDPAPEIKLGQTYNFQEQVPSALISPNLGFEQDFTISSPEENEKINTQIPEFFGTGNKGKPLEILIESDVEISGKIVVDNQGKWRWSPNEPIPPGKHKITVSFVDANGFLKKISRDFTVLAAEESGLPSFTATPSGEIITPSPTSIPTPTSKTTTAPTKIPTAIPTVALTPTRAPLSSGTGLPTWLFLGGGIITVILGAVFLLL